MDGWGEVFKAMRNPQTRFANLFLICSKEKIGFRPNFDGDTG
jgi:hypothetical protein